MTLSLPVDLNRKEGDSEVVAPNRTLSSDRRPTPTIFYVIFGMSAGALLVAAGFAFSRASRPHADVLYWAGQIIVVAVPALYLSIRRPSRAQSAVLAIAIPIINYVIVESYSPIQFRFLDELQHVQTAQGILQTHHLFSANTSLPVSPYFPGLEIATTAFSQLSHLSIYAAGTVIIGTAHVLTALGLYLLVMEIYDRPRLATLAVLFYSTEPHYQFFDSYFTYETIAMPFLIASLLAYTKMVKSQSREQRLGWLVVGMFSVFVTVVSHHVTSYVLVIFLVFLTVVERFRRQSDSAAHRYAAVMTLGAAALVAGWDIGVAQGLLQYLEPAVHSITRTTSSATKQLGGGNQKNQSGIVLRTPSRDAIAEYAATLLLLLLVTFGLWTAWRNRRFQTRSLQSGFLLLSISVYALVVVRLATSDGSELAGRAYSFAMLPGSVACALTFLSLVASARHAAVKRAAVFRAGGGVALLLVLLVGGIAGGWPVFYARLPGPFLVSAWERSVDTRNLAVGEWAAKYLPKRAGVASNWVTGNVLGELGNLSNVPGTANLFLSTKFVPELRTLVADREVRYVAIDMRILSQAPQNGSFFDNDPFSGHYAGGLGLAAYLDKFATTKGVSEVYSDGTIAIFDLLGSEYKQP